MHREIDRGAPGAESAGAGGAALQRRPYGYRYFSFGERRADIGGARG